MADLNVKSLKMGIDNLEPSPRRLRSKVLKEALEHVAGAVLDARKRGVEWSVIAKLISSRANVEISGRGLQDAMRRVANDQTDGS